MHQRRREELERTGGPLEPEERAQGWHFCPEWDEMLIGPGWPEMASCLCGGINRGDLRITLSDPPPFNITFHDEGREIGRLDWNREQGRFEFKGQTDESAALFMQLVVNGATHQMDALASLTRTVEDYIRAVDNDVLLLQRVLMDRLRRLVERK